MVKPKQVGHLVINVSDVAASTKFYTEILGFEIAVSRPTATFLTCGEIHHDLALFQASEDSPTVGKGHIGLNHFAVQVEDHDSLRDLYHTLLEHDVKVDRTTRPRHDRQRLFRGPRRQRHRVLLRQVRHR